MARRKKHDYFLEACIRGMDACPVPMTPTLHVVAARPAKPTSFDAEAYFAKPVVEKQLRVERLSKREQSWACKYVRYQSAVGCPMLAAALLVISELQAMEAQSEYLTPAEAGTHLRSSPETVIKLIRDGNLKAANMSAATRPRYLIQLEAIREFVERRSVHSNPQIQREPKRVTRAYNRFSEG